MSIDSINIPIEVSNMAVGSLYATDISNDKKVQKLLPSIETALFDTKAKAVAGDVVVIFFKDNSRVPQICKLAYSFLSREYWNMGKSEAVISFEIPDSGDICWTIPASSVSHIHKAIGGLDSDSKFIDYDRTPLAERMMASEQENDCNLEGVE